MNMYVLILTAKHSNGLAMHSVSGFQSLRDASEAGDAWIESVEAHDKPPGVTCVYSVTYHREGVS